MEVLGAPQLLQHFYFFLHAEKCSHSVIPASATSLSTLALCIDPASRRKQASKQSNTTKQVARQKHKGNASKANSASKGSTSNKIYMRGVGNQHTHVLWLLWNEGFEPMCSCCLGAMNMGPIAIIVGLIFRTKRLWEFRIVVSIRRFV